MNIKLNRLLVLAFVGFLAGGIHLSYGEFKGTGLSRLPMPAAQVSAPALPAIPFIADAVAADER